MDVSRFAMALKPSHLLTGLGALVAAQAGFRFLDFLWLYALRPSSLSRYAHGSRAEQNSNTQPWALITGSSDGIGLGFAEELCSRGFNVILHGRNAQKLAGVRSKLLQQWPTVCIRIAILDAIDFTEESMDKMLEQFSELNITILINNVGGVPPKRAVFVPFHELEQNDIDGYTSINARFPTILTNKLLPRLIKNGPALIINVGSMTGMLPTPNLSVYSGTKGYIAMWGDSLLYEMLAGAKDVEVLTLNVAEVQNQWDRSAPTFLRPSARRFAQHALHKVGSGRSYVTPYTGHALMTGFFRGLPEFMRRRIVVNMSKELLQRDAKLQEKKE